MDIVQAKAIPLRRIFEVLGITAVPTMNGLQLYKSPFDTTRKTMLVVNPITNTWIDPNTNEEGDTISLVCTYLESEHLSHNAMDALRWMRNMIGCKSSKIELPTAMPDYKTIDRAFKVKDYTYLSDPLLLQYVEDQRALPFHIAREHFQQVTLLNKTNGKSFIALAVRNEDGGFAIRNALQKAQVGKRAVTFIPGKLPKPVSVHIFKDMFDYLSAIQLQNGKHIDGDSIILNSYDCMPDMTAYVSNYGYEQLHSWLGNDDIGNSCTKAICLFCKAEQLKHHNQQEQYRNFHDPNDKLVRLHRLPFSGGSRGWLK